jgi:hypothetical protein
LTEASIAGHRVALHLARTTINSCLASPVPLSNLFSTRDLLDYAEHCVTDDLLKQHFDRLQHSSFDYLLLDLVDERHRIIVLDGFYVCQSVCFLRMVEKLKLDVTRFERRSPQDPKLIAETLASIPRFVERLCANIDPRRIFVHEALGATTYFNSEGVLKTFLNEAEILVMNDILTKYYHKLKAEGNFCSIALPKDMRVADARHRWFLSPFHYTSLYYHQFLVELNRLMR